MKVLVAINGSVISESMALYALRYAKQLGYALELFHLSNAKDDLKSVEKTFAHIQTLAKAQDVEFQALLFSSSLENELCEYVKKESVDIIFCSTRREKKLFEDSFSHKLLKLAMDVDLAIVRIVKLVDISTLSSMMLPIKQERLSVRKFTFFATLASSYEARGQHSISILPY
jgi:K+-sensing histidine kinase KdpD